MSDCSNSRMEPYDDVLRGKVVFTDGTEMSLSYYRYGRTVDHFVMDGVKYMPEKTCRKVVSAE